MSVGLVTVRTKGQTCLLLFTWDLSQWWGLGNTSPPFHGNGARDGQGHGCCLSCSKMLPLLSWDKKVWFPGSW